MAACLATLIVSAVVLSQAGCAHEHSPSEKVRILLVGNSVVYTNNLPRVVEAIALASPGAQVPIVDMVARGGATIAGQDEDGAVTAIVDRGRYDAVFLQERGGDVLCVLALPSDSDCAHMLDAHRRLVAHARAAGARIFELGTYQPEPSVSRALERAEARLAEIAGAEPISISEHLIELRRGRPDLPWLDADGAHPGAALTTLMAVEIFYAVEHRPLVPSRLCIDGPAKGPRWKPADTLTTKSDDAGTFRGQACILEADQVSEIVEGLARLRSTVLR